MATYSRPVATSVPSRRLDDGVPFEDKMARLATAMARAADRVTEAGHGH